MQCSDTNGGLESGWYAVHLMPEDEAFFPKKKWGTQSFTFQPVETASDEGPTSHVDGRGVRTPEGLVFILSCTVCGGRREFLVDFRTVANQARHGTQVGLSQTEMMHACFERGMKEFDDRITAFTKRHSGCAEDPCDHRLPTTVQRRVGEILTATQRQVRAGALRAKIYLIGNDGKLALAPFHDIPDGTDDDPWRKRAELEHRKQAIRDWMSEAAFPLEGILFVSAANAHPVENGAPTPDEFADGTEGVAVVVGTENFSKSGFAPLEVGPGDSASYVSLDELELFGTSYNRPTDGLFSVPLLAE